ncbi:MAG: hypothetical protein ACTS3F_04275 [Phycisphaerales bacterium]
MPRNIHAVALAAIVPLALAAHAPAQSGESLAQYFGFEDTRAIVVDPEFGPVIAVDIDGDGLSDILAVNNRKSRIEIFRQRSEPKSDAEMESDFRINELPPSRYFDRSNVSLANRVSAIQAFDVNADSRVDLILAGRQPSELITMVQTEPLSFEQAGTHRVRDISAAQFGMVIADLMGGPGPELGVTAGDRVHVYGISSIGPTGEPTILGSSSGLAAIYARDFDGDGLTDLLGAYPEDTAPLRLWLQQRPPESADSGGKRGFLGSEVRLEMAPIIEAEPMAFPGRAASSVAVIERASRRVVVYDFERQTIELDPTERTERDAPMVVGAFSGGADRDRSVVVADIDGDGLTDLLVTHRAANSMVLHRQRPGVGLGDGRSYAALQNPKTLAAGQWDTDLPLEVFVLSEDERTVGVCNFDPSTGSMSVPVPLPIETAGATPVAMNYARLNDGPAVAVVVQDRRDHVLELHRPGEGSTVRTIPLADVRRPPQSIISGDFDHDGFTDLALFTPNEPMIMVRSVDNPDADPEVLNDRTMRNFGIVQAAGPFNTALFDADGDGYDELLIANKNTIRACAFDVEKGWSFIEQIALEDANANFTGLGVLTRGDDETKRLIAADRQNGRLVLIDPTPEDWSIADRLRLGGFQVDSINAGAFAGDNEPSILAFGEQGYALVKLAGQRVALSEVDAYRSDDERRFEHELASGDVNGDGFVDLVVLDAGENFISIMSFSESRRLHDATEFKVFESRLFQSGFGGRGPQEPRAVIVHDLTGDAREDILVIVHDRMLLYPQATQPR